MSDFWKYDTLNDSWTQVASINVNRTHAFCFVSQGKGYVGGGNPPITLNDVQAYDPVTNQWTAVANMPVFSDTPKGMTINDTGYIYCPGPFNDFHKYNPGNNTWSLVANFPGATAYYCAAVSIGDNGYLMTGYSGGAGNKRVYKYNSINDTWTQMNDFPGSGRIDATAFSVNGMGYLGHGEDTIFHYCSDFWEYDPILDSWQQVASFPGPARSNSVAFTIGNFGYCGMGAANDDFYKYSPSSTSVTETNRNLFSAIVKDQSIIIHSIAGIGYEIFALSGKKIISGTTKEITTIDIILPGIYIVRLNGVQSVKVFVS